MNILRLCVAIGVLTSVTSIEAQVIVSHSGMNDPNTQGFTPDGVLTNGSGIDDNGTPAWRVASGTAGQELLYDYTLSPTEIADANANGYVLRANLRIPTANKNIGSDTMGFWAQLNDDWWLLRFSTDSNANPTAVIHEGGSFAVSGSGYHLYELVYDPANQNADLFIDGVERLSDQTPANNPGTVFRFGDGDGSFTGAEIMYNLVEFEILGTTVPENFTWNQSGSGDWMSASNWSPNGIPDTNRETAIFGGIINSPQTVFVNSAATVNRVEFDNMQSYVVSGFGNITLEASTLPKNPSIAVAQGAHQFQAAVNLNNATSLDIAGGATLEFVNRLNLNGNTLTKTGQGTLVISNTLSTGSGTLVCGEGSCMGTGSIAGNVINNGGNLSPGNNSVANQVVPEPSSLVLGLAGILGLFRALMWRKRR